MADNEQLARIEARLAEIEVRLRSLEAQDKTQVQSPQYEGPPPPQVVPYEPHAARPNAPGWKMAPLPVTPVKKSDPPKPLPPSTPAKNPVRQNRDAEYAIGAKILPRVGAAVFLLGVAFLVGLAINRHMVSEPMKFAGEIALFAGFIILGLIKRNEREDFGQLLVGIGSCGLYFSFAGAEAYQKLITGNTLVCLFMALSFANLAFSWWRESRSFFVIGIMGGLIGALLPLKENNLLVNGLLQLSIVVVGALVVSRHKWFAFAIGLFLAAMGAACAALFPVYGDEWKQLTFLYSDALICFAALVYCRRDTAYDRYDLLLPFAVFGVGILGFCVRDELKGTVHLAIFGLAVTLLSLCFGKASVSRNRLLAGAAAVILLLCPGGYQNGAVAIYSLLAIASAYLVLYRFRVRFLILSWLETAFAAGSFVTLVSWDRPWQTELALAAIVTAASLSVGWATSRQKFLRSDQRDFVVIVSAALSTLFLVRAGYLVTMHLDPKHRDLLAIFAPCLVLSLFTGCAACIRPSRYLAAYAGVMGAFAALFYLAACAPPPILSWRLELGVIVPSILSSFALARALVRAFPDSREWKVSTLAKYVAAVPSTGLFLRAGYLIGMQLDPLHRVEITQTVTGLVLAFTGCLILLARRDLFVLIWAWAMGAYSAAEYLALLQATGMSVAVELTLIVLFAVLVLSLSRTNLQMSEDQRPTRVAAILFLAALLLRSGFLIGVPLDPWHRTEVSQMYTGVLAAALCCLLALKRPSWVETAFAWILGGYAAGNYANLVLNGRFTVREDLVMLSLLIALTMAILRGTLKLADRDSTMTLGAVLLWALFCRLMYIVLTMKSVGMSDPAAISIAWTAYAVILISVGFIRRITILRYLALFLFALTLAKVFLYDLATLDAGLRVGVLMGLGLAMIMGGYLYIRGKKRLEEPTP